MRSDVKPLQVAWSNSFEKDMGLAVYMAIVSLLLLFLSYS